MFAIIDIAGQQFKVKQGEFVYTNRLAGEAGEAVAPKVLMVADGSSVKMGSGSVSGEIIEHIRGEKVITFHKKRRKGYEKTIGHRQYLTKVKINTIA
jgi:large subunit ribosomal protein L21